MPFVEMGTTFITATGTPPNRPTTSAPAWPTAVETGQPLFVRDLHRVLDGVGERAEPAPEDHADGRLQRGVRPDRGGRLVEPLAQIEPSARREPIVATMRWTTSSGSSVT